MSQRFEHTFARLKAEGRGALVTYVTGGDPDFETSKAVITGLPGAGADIIEIGMPFSDPMADGPAIQAANIRSLNAGGSLSETLDIVRAVRKVDDATPVVLMGYYNPIYRYGADAFARDAAAAGVDGLIVVDLPPEEAGELLPALEANAIDLIFLTTPTTDDDRLPVVLKNAGGFVYYVSILGVTGTTSATEDAIATAVARIRRHTDLPVCVGFGIKTPEQAAAVSKIADGAVIGSAVVNQIAANVDEHGVPKPGLVDAVLGFVGDLARGVRG